MAFLSGFWLSFAVLVVGCAIVLSIAGYLAHKSLRTQAERWTKVLEHLTALETKQPKTVAALADLSNALQIELSEVRKSAEEAKTSARSNRMRINNLKKQLAGETDETPEVVQTQRIRLPGMIE